LASWSIKIWWRGPKERRNNKKPTSKIQTVINSKWTTGRRNKRDTGITGRMIMRKEQEIGMVGDYSIGYQSYKIA
jgi:hypothetical protein